MSRGKISLSENEESANMSGVGRWWEKMKDVTEN